MKRYWVRWTQPTEDHRPLHYPPSLAIIGWWCTGYDAENQAILCAWVQAKSSAQAMMSVEIEWPEVPMYDFVDEVPDRWKPSDRFPLSEWMVERC